MTATSKHRPLGSAGPDAPVSCSLYRALCALLLTVLLATVGIEGASDVSLHSITIYKHFSWPFTPSIYFQCQGQNSTDLAFVKDVLHYYHLNGTEPWQPVARLDPHSCQQCGLYQHGVFSDSTFSEWEICTSNFSENRVAALLASNTASINLACPKCAENDDETSASPSRGRGHQGSDGAFPVWIALFSVFGCLALTVTIATVILILTKDNGPMVYEEQSRMLELEPQRQDSLRPEAESFEKRHGVHILTDDSEDYV